MKKNKKEKGIKHDSNKPMMCLIPPEANIYEAKVWTEGMKAYGLYNWKNGLDVTRIISALERHLTAIKLGQNLDPFSGLPHAAHIRCDAAMLIKFLDTEFDDRDKNYTEEEVNKFLKEMGYYKE